MDDNPGATARPGSFLFDPVLGATLFTEIQAEGLRAASVLVERLVHLVDGSPTTTPADREADPADESSPPAGSGPEVGAVLPWFELWRDLAERSADALQRFQGAGVGPTGEGVRVGVDGSLAPTHPLTINVDTGGRGHGEVWLHNGTPSEHGELVPHCGPLSDEYGQTLVADAEFAPPKIDGLPARSSRGFIISVRVDPASAPGTYRGIVQVRGADAVWMPLEVVVPARSS
jgi:hypothetical protein